MQIKLALQGQIVQSILKIVLPCNHRVSFNVPPLVIEGSKCSDASAVHEILICSVYGERRNNVSPMSPVVFDSFKCIIEKIIVVNSSFKLQGNPVHSFVPSSLEQLAVSPWAYT